ncbi:MAG TPA: hypothetical protein VJW17_05860 [Pyrinomonadaceae bacterium]|nr:hypothetical protein [Pyrinomonadaceae bacterium]
MNKLKPALLGGLIVGLLSAIPFINYCCCIWGIGGGVLAGFLYIKESPTRIGPGDGAMIGALAGVVGAIIYIVIGVPIAYVFGAAAVEESFARAGIHIPVTGFLLFLLSGLLGGICLLCLSVIGGLISVQIFEKRKDVPPPPPPQQYPSA